MGWASAGEIFDNVAHSLVEAGVDDAVLDRVLYQLAVSLTEQDWDTVDESVDEFAGHPVVQNALRKANGSLYLYDAEYRIESILEFVGNADGGVWELRSSSDGRTEAREATAAGFNELLDIWAADGDAAGRAEEVERYRLS